MAEDVTVAEVEDWVAGLEEVNWRIGPRFVRPEPRAQAAAYLRGGGCVDTHRVSKIRGRGPFYLQTWPGISVSTIRGQVPTAPQ